MSGDFIPSARLQWLLDCLEHIEVEEEIDHSVPIFPYHAGSETRH